MQGVCAFAHAHASGQGGAYLAVSGGGGGGVVLEPRAPHAFASPPPPPQPAPPAHCHPPTHCHPSTPPQDMNLRELTKRYGRGIGLSLAAVRVYAQQMLVGLYHLRNCGVLHADIKPDNIL